MKKDYTDLTLYTLFQNTLTFPNFPKEGVLFRDILPLIMSPTLRSDLIEVMELFIPHDVNCIVAPESRGFLLGVLLAEKLHLKFVPVRKAGKLPGNTSSVEYDTEYSTEVMEIQSNSLSKSDICFFVDDIYATGGTYKAIKTLVTKNKATLKGGLVLMDVLNSKPKEIVELFEKFKGEQNDEDK